MITPQPQAKQLAEALGLNTGLYLKREDLHPFGSHKGRSIPLMIEHYASEGYADFCVSSSGNAALAAIYAVKELNKKAANPPLTLRVFVGKHIAPDKLERLRQASANPGIYIEQVAMPKRTAFQMDKERRAKNLRQSTDDTALIGYETLADELAEIKNLAAVFIPTSSGTTAQALHEEFLKLGLNPQIHIAQTPACHPLVDDSPAGTSVANAIVDKVGYRKEAVRKAIKNSRGNGWIATDNDILEAKRQIKETEDLDISPNSALSVAGLKLALQKNWHFDGPVVCLLTGR